MGFVAWLDSDTSPVAREGVAPGRPDAHELERHVEIIRTSREAPVVARAEPVGEPEPPRAA
jgi:hypothetical protein